MNRYLFEIGKVNIELSSREKLLLKGDSALFEKPCKSNADIDLNILCDMTDIPSPEGQLLGKGNNCIVYRQGNTIKRALLANEKVYAVQEYELGNHSVAHLQVGKADWRWAMDYMRMWITACLPSLLLYFHMVILHAAYIEHAAQGILFTAPSGTGKSTQAELWRKYRNAKVLNGDKAGIRLDGQPMVHGVPFSGTSGICENVTVPLKAIVLLSQAPENTIRQLSVTEAVTALCPNVFVDKLVPEEWSIALNILIDIVSHVPVYLLACTPDERAVDTLEHALKC